jgi:hypothetical protein
MFQNKGNHDIKPEDQEKQDVLTCHSKKEKDLNEILPRFLVKDLSNSEDELESNHSDGDMHENTDTFYSTMDKKLLSFNSSNIFSFNDEEINPNLLRPTIKNYSHDIFSSKNGIGSTTKHKLNSSKSEEENGETIYVKSIYL